MKKATLLCVVLFMSTIAFSQKEKDIFGIIYHLKMPVVKAKITNVNSALSVLTDFDGKYKIRCQVGDRLQFEYPGLNTVVIKVEDVTRVLNLEMTPKITPLDEVTVVASGRKSQAELEQEYSYNDRIIRTSFEFMDVDRTPGLVQFMSKEEINPVGLCILDVLRAQFAGVRVQGDCNRGGAVFMRATGSISGARPAAFDIDGVLFTEAPFWLDINNIERIALFRSLNLTVLYGKLGAGGVIVINTRTGNPKISEIVDRARLRHNFINGKLLSKSEVLENSPKYLAALEAAKTIKEAIDIYHNFRLSYANFPYFHLDAYRYFMQKWRAIEVADGIIEENFGLFRDNPVLLKALAYSYDEDGRYEKANEIYKEIFILRPNYAQSYMDMANSYRNIGEKKQASGLYARYDHLLATRFLEIDTVGFETIMNREHNNLLSLHKNVVLGEKMAKGLYVAEEVFKGTRLVFEWNDAEAEFDLQFVNPGDQYYTWKHTLAENPEEIIREKDFGYNVKEYLVDDSLPGQWQVNINYFGNKSLSPTYLKATVYHEYGSANQRKESKVFRLSVKDVNQELFKLNIGGAISTR